MQIEPLETLATFQGSEDGAFDPAKALVRSFIDPEKPEPLPQIVISIKDSRFATLGNFSVVIGKAKSGKTYSNTLIIAGITGGNVPGIEGSLYAAIFDTEQSRGDAQRVYSDRVKSLGGCLSNSKLFSIKAFSPQERQEIIAHYIKENPQTKLIIIDGIRDLLSDINSPEQSTDLATWLMKLLDEFNIHILTVLHQNKGDNNARGHIGTELTNKAESVMSVTKNADEVFTCHAEYTRAKPFEDISFKIDENGLPEILEDYRPKSNDERRKDKKILAPSDVELTDQIEIAKAVFNGLPLKYEDVWRKIKLNFQKQQKLKFGDNKAKDFVTFWIDEGIILKNEKLYTFNQNYDAEPLY